MRIKINMSLKTGLWCNLRGLAGDFQQQCKSIMKIWATGSSMKATIKVQWSLPVVLVPDAGLRIRIASRPRTGSTTRSSATTRCSPSSGGTGADPTSRRCCWAKTSGSSGGEDPSTRGRTTAEVKIKVVEPFFFHFKWYGCYDCYDSHDCFGCCWLAQ